MWYTGGNVDETFIFRSLLFSCLVTVFYVSVFFSVCYTISTVIDKARRCFSYFDFLHVVSAPWSSAMLPSLEKSRVTTTRSRNSLG